MTSARPGPFTVVSFHAHPDDEALLTAGTLARLAAEGHRVVLVTATAGEAGLTGHGWSGAGLGARRLRELEESARAIGAARVECLDYRDSGWGAPGPVDPGSFSELATEPVAQRLAALLREEDADVLTTYDAAGGYGHPDHVQVHRVGARAAEIAGTPLLLEATLDRTHLVGAVGLLRRLSRLLPVPELPDVRAAYTPRSELTHRVDVRAHLAAKEAALGAHVSQAAGARVGDTRTLALLLRLPRPVGRLVLGHEWFREVGRRPGTPLLDDVLATLRG
ncbi:PIG-L deacetylase family protein [Nocardioides mangrovi]|uniref:PIG-L family deacetylase n=1 Tax=Nocardioides mangrovi TaxID=2874580 RepID=A0ABS7U868_9ACTN|nr:PIG-L family deacetylase [Nocardioides mangrovi]MBZ5737169.1 PIG-L family deacetylase [Nocardioides mangrovi]